MLKTEERTSVGTSIFPPSCAYAVVPPILEGRYMVVLPDPGERARALTQAGEMIFSVPAQKLPDLVDRLIRHQNDDSKFANLPMQMRPDFVQPELYKKIFEGWDMEHHS